MQLQNIHCMKYTLLRMFTGCIIDKYIPCPVGHSTKPLRRQPAYSGCQCNRRTTACICNTKHPDSGWFVIWEDNRNNALSKTDIYAQKYDKLGNALWTAKWFTRCKHGANDQHFTWGSNEDYRNRHYMPPPIALVVFI